MKTGLHDMSAYSVREEVPGRWCYAAVEQALRKVLLEQDMSQTEIAHNCFLREASRSSATTGDFGLMAEYAKRVAAQLHQKNYEQVVSDPVWWNSVKADLPAVAPFDAVTLTDQLAGLLKKTFGSIGPQGFDSRGVLAVTPEDFSGCQNALAAGCLVVAMSSVHMYIVWDYDPATHVMSVYDPSEGIYERPGADFAEIATEWWFYSN